MDLFVFVFNLVGWILNGTESLNHTFASSRVVLNFPTKTIQINAKVSNTGKTYMNLQWLKFSVSYKTSVRTSLEHTIERQSYAYVEDPDYFQNIKI